ncbi:plasmid partition protein ParG, partial [Citrobacter braakii]|uniref:plasmid partition protein ParG n=1 Tax=Citrobacter braakii TaxID=57706 RepID=UPI002165D7B5
GMISLSSTDYLQQCPKQGTSITDVIKDLVDNWLKENDSQKTQMSKNTLTQKHTYPYREH